MGGETETGIPTPEQTPERDIAKSIETLAENATQDREKWIQEATAEIRRVKACGENSFGDTLGVKTISEDDRVLAWKKLGCLLHEKQLDVYAIEQDLKDRAEAWTKLRAAAEQLGVEDRWLSEVDHWDGIADLTDDTEDDEEESDDEDNGESMKTDDVEMPPEAIMHLYEKATVIMQALKVDIGNTEASNQIMAINGEIKNATKEYNTLNKNHTVSEDLWLIQDKFWGPSYMRMKQYYDELTSNPKNAKKCILTEIGLRNIHVKQRHVPNEWAIPLRYKNLPIKRVLRELTQSGSEREHRSASLSTVEYSWPTRVLPDGSVIIGWRYAGRGKRLCIERQEGNKIIRRLEPASDISPSRFVDEYTKMDGSKNLAAGQDKWTKDFKDDFVKLHWITRSQTKLKNTAAGRRDPEAYCCVEFKKEGVQILTRSRFERVLKTADARAEIKAVCARDGFPEPWNSQPAVTYYDEVKLEKDPEKRRQMKDEQASQPQKNRYGGRSYESSSVNMENGGRRGSSGSGSNEGLEASFDALAREMKAAMVSMNETAAAANKQQAELRTMFMELMANMNKNTNAATAAS